MTRDISLVWPAVGSTVPPGNSTNTSSTSRKSKVFQHQSFRQWWRLRNAKLFEVSPEEEQSIGNWTAAFQVNVPVEYCFPVSSSKGGFHYHLVSSFLAEAHCFCLCTSQGHWYLVTIMCILYQIYERDVKFPGMEFKFRWRHALKCFFSLPFTVFCGLDRIWITYGTTSTCRQHTWGILSPVLTFLCVMIEF